MGSKYGVWILGAAALALGAWYLFGRSGSSTKSEIQELADTIRRQNEELDKLEAAALAAAQKAQEALNQALNAADTAGVVAGASSYTSAEGNNQQAQTAASANPSDQAAQAAAAAAAEASANARAQLEASFAAQLAEAEAAAAKAKVCLEAAYASYQEARRSYSDYQAYIASRSSDTSRICGYLHHDGGQRGSSKAFRLGDTRLADFNDCASSYTLFPGYKILLFEHADFSGRTYGWLYGNEASNIGELTGFNDVASAIRCEAYPNARVYVAGLADKLALADRIKLEVTNCQVAINGCIERQQSILDQIRAYNVLSSRAATSESSLAALRNYVAGIRV